MRGSTQSNLLVKVEWLLRDIRTDEQVSLLYKASSDIEWQRAEVNRRDSDPNAFSATMALNPAYDYSFRVEATSADSTRSSDVRTIPRMVFKAPAVILSFHSSSRYSTGLSKYSYSVIQQGLPHYSVHKVSSMEVHYYAGETLRNTTPLQLEVAEGNSEQRYMRWVMSLEVTSSITSVVLVATMADGSTRNIATLSNFHQPGLPTITMHYPR